MVFKIDIDGVLRDIVTPMCRLYNEKTGESISPSDVTEYDTRKIFDKVEDPKKFFFEDNAIEVFERALPFEGVAVAVQRIRELGHQVKIVSFQHSNESRLMALNWLEKHGIKYDLIVFTCTNEKRGIEGDVLIEDCPDNLRKEDPTKAVRICIDRPYNCLDDNNELRVSSLLELVEKYIEPNRMPKKKTNDEPKIETVLDALKVIAEEMVKIRNEIDCLNRELGMMASRDSSRNYLR